MAVYRSKLKTLEKLRAATRDEKLRRVADALRAEAALADQFAALEAEMLAAKQHHQSLRSEQLDVQAILELERYELLLKTQSQAIATQQQTVADECRRRQEELSAAQQEVRVIEKLDDKRRKAFHQQERRVEQATMDELASQQFLRRRRNTQPEA